MLLLDTFHHRGETIRLVNEGLSDPIKAASDELIAAVSVLLTVEVCNLPRSADLVYTNSRRLQREIQTTSKSTLQALGRWSG